VADDPNEVVVDAVDGTAGTPGIPGTDGVGDPGNPGAAGTAGVGTDGTPGTDTGAAGGSATDTIAGAAAGSSLIASNQGDATNWSDGSASIGTGNATATGSTSKTVLDQDLTAAPDGGLVVTLEAGGVLNAGLAAANTGANDVVGNESSNTSTLVQTSTIVTGPDALLLGGAIVGNSGVASNASDGEACVCTGNATASGNISDTRLAQDLTVGTDGGGLVVLPTVGIVANLGLGLADSGQNTSTGNSSDNTATVTQDATIDIDELTLVPQIADQGGEAANVSDGKAAIGTGNATAIGNLSTTAMEQAASATSTGTPVVAALTGATLNAGAGIASTGSNTAVGNDSVNVATLVQSATGQGLVSNHGAARNESDGTAIIGNPDCAPTPEAVPHVPAAPGLPRTGGPIEVEAAIALLLLLAGFGLQDSARRRGRLA
jgi:hypothetical protein